MRAPALPATERIVDQRIFMQLIQLDRSQLFYQGRTGGRTDPFFQQKMRLQPGPATGTEADRGELPDDFGMLSKLISDVCFHNANQMFGFDV